MHETIIRHRSNYHNDRRYRIRMTKMETNNYKNKETTGDHQQRTMSEMRY